MLCCSSMTCHHHTQTFRTETAFCILKLDPTSSLKLFFMIGRCSTFQVLAIYLEHPKTGVTGPFIVPSVTSRYPRKVKSVLIFAHYLVIVLIVITKSIHHFNPIKILFYKHQPYPIDCQKYLFSQSNHLYITESYLGRIQGSIQHRK